VQQLKQLGQFLTRHRAAFKVLACLITLAGGGGLIFSESFRNNIFYFGGKHRHEHQTIIHDHRTYTTLHQENDTTSKLADADDTDHKDDELAIDIEAEKRLKLEHRHRLRERAKLGGETQTIQMTPD
jgi:hypothetical protein